MPKSDAYYAILLLRAIRDGHVSSWKTLEGFQREHGLQFVDWGSAAYGQRPSVVQLLMRLQRAALIDIVGVDLERDIWVRRDSFSRPPRRDVVVYDAGTGRATAPKTRQLKVGIAPTWQGVQSALGVSLASLAALQMPRAMIVAPTDLPEPRQAHVAPDVFVIMPFRAELNPVYEDHIRRVCAQRALSVERADDFFTTHAVMADVWTSIQQAKVLIADCTDRNPNVFYEIGLAHALGRPVILVSQSAKDIPFDLGHLRYIEYAFTPRGMEELEAKLAATIDGLLGEQGAATAHGRGLRS